MDFRVELTDQAKHDIASVYAWLQTQDAGEAGTRWFVSLREAINSLGALPGRCRVAPESGESPVEIRQLLYGRRPHVYRILFAIDDQVVHVLHVRHGRRGPPERATPQFSASHGR
jgi:plasmid stabilization system protein ParE